VCIVCVLGWVPNIALDRLIAREPLDRLFVLEHFDEHDSFDRYIYKYFNKKLTFYFKYDVQ
jgi:hypothetical protein